MQGGTLPQEAFAGEDRAVRTSWEEDKSAVTGNGAVVASRQETASTVIVAGEEENMSQVKEDTSSLAGNEKSRLVAADDEGSRHAVTGNRHVLARSGYDDCRFVVTERLAEGDSKALLHVQENGFLGTEKEEYKFVKIQNQNSVFEAVNNVVEDRPVTTGSNRRNLMDTSARAESSENSSVGTVSKQNGHLGGEGKENSAVATCSSENSPVITGVKGNRREGTDRQEHRVGDTGVKKNGTVVACSNGTSSVSHEDKEDVPVVTNVEDKSSLRNKAERQRPQVPDIGEDRNARLMAIHVEGNRQEEIGKKENRCVENGMKECSPVATKKKENCRVLIKNERNSSLETEGIENSSLVGDGTENSVLETDNKGNGSVLTDSIENRPLVIQNMEKSLLMSGIIENGSARTDSSQNGLAAFENEDFSVVLQCKEIASVGTKCIEESPVVTKSVESSKARTNDEENSPGIENEEFRSVVYRGKETSLVAAKNLENSPAGRVNKENSNVVIKNKENSLVMCESKFNRPVETPEAGRKENGPAVKDRNEDLAGGLENGRVERGSLRSRSEEMKEIRPVETEDQGNSFTVTGTAETDLEGVGISSKLCDGMDVVEVSTDAFMVAVPQSQYLHSDSDEEDFLMDLPETELLEQGGTVFQPATGALLTASDATFFPFRCWGPTSHLATIGEDEEEDLASQG
jgi:hypothetical protein